MPMILIPVLPAQINSSRTQYPDVSVPPGGFPAGTACGIISVLGQLRLIAVGSLDNATSFTGFLPSDIAVGNPVVLITGRGSIATPQVEGGVPLVPDQGVWLSLTPGFVTQTPPEPEDTPGLEIVLRVGTALDTTRIFMLTDSYIQYGS